MPNCFTLTRKSEPEKGPVPLAKIDEEMCDHFGVPVDAKRYHSWWYDIYGFAVAMGRTIQEVIDRNAPKPEDDAELTEEKLHIQEVGRWLDANFTTDAWVQVGK